MLFLIPALPFAGFLINALLGRRLPKAVSGTVACAALCASFVVSAAAFWQMLAAESHAIERTLFTWIASGSFNAPFTFRLDPLGGLMVLIVTGIGFLIHVYSTGYMHEESDREYARYFSYLNLFAAFMLVLVLGANFLVMFVGWEGVGLCSYLLIGFWFTKKSATDAGNKAFVVNRIGDAGFILGMLLIFREFGTLDFQAIAREIAPLAPEATFGVLSAMTLLLFIGAAGKSAQIPLYVWLPDAMEGPTPVSALIHAATMVTAGVYMIGRNAVMFGHAPETLAIVAGIGVATALMAGTIGLVQTDIKRVLAYSTVSQLGLMFLAMGVGAFAAGIFHLYTHAFFKALLFLGSGAVIHALAGEQDLRRMGGLKRYLPITYWTFVVGALSIAGVPLLSGFFSKDEILYRAFAGGHTILWMLGAVTSLLTAIYMFRVVFLAFHGDRAQVEEHFGPKASAHPEEREPVAEHPETHSAHGAPASERSGTHGAPRATEPGDEAEPRLIHDGPPSMAIPLIVLAIGSVLAGYVGVPHALGGSNRIESFLAPSFHAEGAAAEHAPPGDHPGATELTLMAISSGIAVAGIGIAAFLFLRHRDKADALATRFAGVHRLLLNKYYVDEIYDATIVQPIKLLAADTLWKGVDARLIDGSINGTGRIVAGGGSILRRLQTGSVRVYAVSLFLGVVLMLGYYLTR